MDARRWRNVTQARLAHRAGSPRHAGSPIQAFVEVSARCNVRCTMCAIHYDPRYDNASGRPPYLTPDLFARLRPLFSTLLRAYLFGLGEPLLNPHLTDYIRELASCGVDVAFTTNGTLIDDAKANALARAGVRHVTVSLDGARAETYEAIRVGARFERVLRGIRALVASGVRVSFSFVAMRSNVEDIPRLVDLCANEGATGVHVEPLLSQVAGTALDDHYRREHLGLVDPDHVRALIAEAKSIAEKRGVAFGSRLTAVRDQFDYVESVATLSNATRSCSEPWSTIWVTVAGEVRTCCLNDTTFGSIVDEPFESIWNGAAYRAFREQHARGDAPSGCANCMRNGRVIASEFFDVVEPVTFRPLFESLPPVTENDDAFLDAPAPGATVQDPLLLMGRMRVDDVDVMIDETPVANITTRAFARSLPVSFLSEGAHVVWLRSREGRGFAHRTIHFWRP
ncbi:MAG TPA: radical SAM protein [Thermoanaerobaculia bacterium]|nr:radical SAM protein [Thermoanaerobaculia bacterium]